MPIISAIGPFLNTKVDVGIYENALMQDKIFNPFVGKKDDAYPLELVSEKIKEWQEQTIILDPETTNYQINFGGVDTIKQLIIKAEVVEYFESAQPDFELKFSGATDFTFKLREYFICQFSEFTDIDVYITNPLIYKMKFKIIAVSGE